MSVTGLLRPPAGARGRAQSPFRPSLEVLEDRAVPASVSQMNLPLDVSNLQVVGNQLQGTVNFAGQLAGTLTAALTTQAPAVAGECPILDLHVGALHLNLLGLHVDTSDICLDVTATDHEGLLGGLLCDLSGGGLNLGGILGEVNGLLGQVDTFLGDLDGLLDNVLGHAFAVDSVFGGGGMAAAQALQAGHVCDVLNLSLGPVDLDVPLLGVAVHLDDCKDPEGPVTVKVTAVESGGLRGGLLGDLLCGLSDGLQGINLGQLVNRIDGLIDRLGDLAGQLGQIADAPALVRRAEHLVDQLTNQLEHLADKVDSLADLDRFIAQVDRVTDRLEGILERIA